MQTKTEAKTDVQARDGSKPSHRHYARHLVRVEREQRPDGSIVIHAPAWVVDPSVTICNKLYEQALAVPDRVFLAQRNAAGGWDELDYATMLAQARSVAQWLIASGFDQSTPLMILSGNSLGHAVMTFGGLLANVPVVPVSPPYSLLSRDFHNLKSIFEAVQPAVLYVEDAAAYTNALAAVSAGGLPVISAQGLAAGEKALALETVLATVATKAVEQRYQSIRPGDTGKILFTSGSTGQPKGVINTHRNLWCAPAARASVIDEQKGAGQPVDIYLDWLPWHHTFGGNAVLNMILYNAATLYIDAGRPLPGQFDETVRNIIEIRPTHFASVPAAFAMLAQYLESNPALCEALFSRVRIFTYGGAALGQSVYERIQAMAVKTCGERIHFTSGCGATETGSMTTAVYWLMEQMGQIGLPLPGSSAKLQPYGSQYALWIKGEHVMPGYLGRPDLNAVVFDEEGFFDTGDAVTWVDEQAESKGFMFAGRTAENFKLVSGTWVQVGEVRLALVDALAPLIQDAVITGQDANYAGALVWPNLAGCAKVCGLDPDADPKIILSSPALRTAFEQRLAAYNAKAGGAAKRVVRLKLLLTPPSIDAGEVTDKRYINQRAVLSHRSADVAGLYAEPPVGWVVG